MKKRADRQSSSARPAVNRRTGGTARLAKFLRHAWDYVLISRSGLFDADWYLTSNGDVSAEDVDPLAHFLLFGAREMRDPNPYFDMRAYVAAYPEASKGNPLIHYLRIGARSRAKPSGAFDPDFYLAYYPDVAKSGLEALGHFLTYGRAEGRRAVAPSLVTRPVEAAELHVVRPVGTLGAEIALFVTHAPCGALKPHVRSHVAALRSRGLSVVVIAALDAFDAPELIGWAEQTDGLYFRANEGYDFAAWAHLARTIPRLAEAQAILLVNDSVIGPLNEDDFDRVIVRLRSSGADLVGLTDNTTPRAHLQSYFLYAKGRGVTALSDFLGTVVSHAEKEQVIEVYETRMLAYFKARNLTGEALFHCDTEHNASVWLWRELIDQGMPFVKVQALRGYPGVDSSRWRELLKQRGFDIAIAQAALDITASAAVGAAQRQPSKAHRLRRLDFLKSLWSLGVSRGSSIYLPGCESSDPSSARRARKTLTKTSEGTPQHNGGGHRDARARIRSMANTVRVAFRRLKQKLVPQSLAADRALVESSGLFDESWYRNRYADLRGVPDALGHYLQPEAYELRAPGPDFDGCGYLARHPDIERAGLNPLVHYLRYGRSEGRSLGLPPRLKPVLVSAIEQFRLIEPEIAIEEAFADIDDLQVARSIINTPINQVWVEIFADLRTSYDRIVFVSRLVPPASTDVAIDAALATIATLGAGSDLFVITDHDQINDANLVPAGADILVLSDYGENLPDAERANLVEILVFALMPSAVLNVNSRACWGAIERRGKALANITELHAFLFGLDNEADRSTVDQTELYLTKCLPHLAVLWTNAEDISSGTVFGYRLPPSLAARLRFVPRMASNTMTRRAIPSPDPEGRRV